MGNCVINMSGNDEVVVLYTVGCVYDLYSAYRDLLVFPGVQKDKRRYVVYTKLSLAPTVVLVNIDNQRNASPTQAKALMISQGLF